MIKTKKNKKGEESYFLLWLILAIIVLLIFVIIYSLIKTGGINLLEKLKNIFSFSNG